MHAFGAPTAELEMPREPPLAAALEAPIGEHAAIGDCRSVALVAKDGTIDWLCWPDFDSASIFAALVDARAGGSWRVGVDRARVERRYDGDSNVLVTRFFGPR